MSKAKRSESISSPLERKSNQLNWNLFHFLENLIVFCTMRTRSVPEESGVRFRIDPRVKDEGICLLFKIDRNDGDSLVPQGEVKPDFLSVFITRDQCIFTIIEMKGKEKSNVEHAIDQIKNLHRHLRKAVDEHLPGSCRTRGKIHYQGLILTPHNADIPRKKIEEEKRKSGLVIFPFQSNHCADLYNPITRKLNLTDKFEHQPPSRLPRQAHPTAKPPYSAVNEFNFIERFFVEGALPNRRKDSLFRERVPDESPKRRRGIYLNFAVADGEKYTTLVTNESGLEWHVPDAALLDQIQAEGARLKILSEPSSSTHSIAEPALQLAGTCVHLRMSHADT